MRRRFGQRGRELAVSRYSSEIVIAHYIDFYEKVIGKSERRAREQAI
jgi:glycosyltransferase involved in cell wall biosynthesis